MDGWDNVCGIAVLGIIVVAMVAILCRSCERREQAFLSAGYERVSTPLTYRTRWAKPESTTAEKP